ncbi:MAG: sulfatase [Gemmatimonadaceae bacterium]
MSALPVDLKHPSLARRVADPIVVSVAAGILTAALHSLTTWISRDLLGYFMWSWISRDTAWMLALGYLLVMVPLGIALAIVGALRRDGVPARAVAFVLATAVAFSVLLLFDRIVSIAWLILALALGWRAGAWAARRERFLHRFCRTLAVAGGSAYLVLGIWATAGRAAREASAIAALRQAEDVMSVLLIILDTVTATDLGAYGNARPTTPTIDSLAAGAIVFEQAFSTSSWTFPSHASMFTGLWPSQHGADWMTPLGAGPPTLAQAFRENGYATGAFTANLIATGSATGLSRGFITYRDTKRTLREIALHSTIAQGTSVQIALERYRKSKWLWGSVRSLLRFDLRPNNRYQMHDSKAAPEVTADFVRWHRALEGRPYFAFLNYFDAHAPYESPMRDRFNAGQTPRDRHEGALRYIDGEIGRVLSALRETGALDRTLVVITADHGELFGEHGLKGHGNSLYRPLLHVPLLIRFPDGPGAATRVTQQVSLRDLAATIVDLSTVPDAHGLGGASLAATWRSPGERTSEALAELSKGINVGRENMNAKGDMHAIADDSLHYIRNGDASFEIYAYRRDLHEKENLAKGPHAALRLGYEAAVQRALGANSRVSASNRRP